MALITSDCNAMHSPIIKRPESPRVVHPPEGERGSPSSRSIAAAFIDENIDPMAGGGAGCVSAGAARLVCCSVRFDDKGTFR